MTSQHPYRDRRWTVLLPDRGHGERATADGQTWPLHSHLQLAALPGAVPDARHHTRRVLAGWDLGALGETAELIVSDSLNLKFVSYVCSGFGSGLAD